MADLFLFTVSASILGWVAADAIRRDLARLPRLVAAPPAPTGCVRILRLVEPSCRVCGCTEDRACWPTCSWVPDPAGLGDLCSACVRAVVA